MTPPPRRVFTGTGVVLVAATALGCSGAAHEVTSTTTTTDAAVTDSSTDDAPSTADAPSGDSPAVETSTDDAPVVPTGSAGCGKAVKSGVAYPTITVNGLPRSYVLSVPEGYDPTRPYPLVFGWHGRMGTGPAFRTYSGVETQAGNKAIFVYPNGLPVTANPADTGWILTVDGYDLALFDALRKDLADDLCVDGKRVFTFGHSLGAYMSNVIGCRRTKDVRAIAAFAGGGPIGTCDGPVAAWIAHSKDDTVVLLSEGLGSRDKWLGLSGCDAGKTDPITPAPCVAYRGCGASAPVTWCNPSFGNHNWPTFAAQGIWEFFADR